MNPIYYFGGLILLGLVFFIFLSLRRKYRFDDAIDELKNIEHYENVRDDLTYRDGKRTKKDKEESSGGFNIISVIISIVIVVIVFSKVLMTTIHTTNVTGWSTSETSLWNTVGLISVVGIVFVMLQAFRVLVLGGSDEEPKKRRKKKMNKKINHYENVRDDLTYRDGKRTTDVEEDIGEEME